MDEELLKRNTDCVYFLASPFTCKKGVECEYRHNEMARLNPRDCWYWTMGSCLNPTCGFRHPPLEVHNDASDEAPASMQNSSAPANKNGVPCYFYYNGYCNKGDRCPFLHGPDYSAAWKSKLTLEVSDAPALDIKSTATAEVALPSAEKHLNPLKTDRNVGDELQVQPKQHVQQFANNEIVEPNALGEVSAHEFREIVTTNLGSLHLPENLATADPSLSSDESSEDQVDDCREREERWESSPGFDVLVDGRSENMGYEDEQEYLQGLNRNEEDLEYHYLDYGYEDQRDYENRILLEKGMHESPIYYDDEHRFDIGDYSPRNSREREVNQTVYCKRKFLTLELPVRGCSDVDLRDHLRKRRMVDNQSEIHDLRRHEVSYLTNRRSERLQRRSSRQQEYGRLAWKLERNGTRLPMEEKTPFIAANRRRMSTNSRHNQSRRYHETSRRSFSDKEARKPFSKRKRYMEGSRFTGPKTLAQIKEERSKAQEGRNCFGKMGQNSSNNMSVDFEGPKPLSELLKDRKAAASFNER